MSKLSKTNNSQRDCDFEDTGDILEAQQLEYRARVRIAERRAMSGDILLHNLLLLTGTDGYARELSETAAPMPPLRSVKDVVLEFQENTDAMQDLVVDVTTHTRVSRKQKEYWGYVGLLLSAVMHEAQSGNGDVSIHPNVAEDVAALIERCTAEELLVLYSTCREVPRGGKDLTAFLEEVKVQVGFRIAEHWLSRFHQENQKTYDALVAKYRLHELRSKDNSTAAITGFTPSVDTRLLRGDPAQVALRKAEGLLSLHGIKATEHETILLSIEVPLDNPRIGRKPDYVCRMWKGIEWTQYNKTHFDQATGNLPPAVVKGYKFDIFYPEFVGVSLPSESKPRFQLMPTSKGWEDTECILKISAGSPYCDIAFRIVNRSWNKNAARGFLSKLEQGVYSLYFQFQYQRYKR